MRRFLNSLALALFWACVPLQAAPLTVTFLDCGQGDAAVVQTPGGKTFLVDAGPNDTDFGGTFDAGKEVVLPFLKRSQVKSVEGLILTHPHLDHYGGAGAVLETLPVLWVLDPGWGSSAPPYLSLLRILDRRKIAYRVAKDGDVLDWEEGLTVKVLAPQSGFYAKTRRRENVNNRSLVIKLSYGRVSFLFMGDAEKESERTMVKRHGAELRAQILKAPHHGSRTSSTRDFLESVHPRWAVISCGRKNPFHHPHPETLKRYEDLKIQVYRTDRDGSLQFTTDGQTVNVTVLGNSSP